MVACLFSVLFAKAYSGGTYDYPFGAALGDSGFVYLVDTHLGEEFNYDVMVLKVDSTGEVVWAKGYDGGGREESYGAHWTGDGLVIVGKTDTNALVFKINSEGELIWAKTFKGSLKTITQLPDGSLVAAGNCKDTSGVLGVSVLVITPSGSLERALWVGTEEELHPWAVAPTRGGFAILAELGMAELENANHLLLKFDASGVLLWAKVYDTGLSDRGLGLVQGRSGNYLITGERFEGASTVAVLVAIDSSGNPVWAEEVGPGMGWLSPALPEEDGYLVGGGYSGDDASSMDFFLAKIDLNGALLWARRLENPGSVFRNADKTFFLADAGDYYLAAGEGAYEYSLTLFAFGWGGEYPGCLDTPLVRTEPIGVSVREMAVEVKNLPWDLTEVPLEAYPVDVRYMDICAPGQVSEGRRFPNQEPCFPVPGGLFVDAREPSDFELYSPTGRLVFQKRVSGPRLFKLKPGVYFWRLGSYRRTGVVR